MSTPQVPDRTPMPTPESGRMARLRPLSKRYGQVLKQAWVARHELAGPRRLATERAFLPAALSLQETPPHPAPRRAMALICAAFFVTLIWATLGQVDVVAVAPGRIIVSERSKVIQPLDAATVRSIHVRDGQTVQEGDLLVELDDTQAGAEHTQTQQQRLIALSEKLRTHKLQESVQSASPPLLLDSLSTSWCTTPELTCEPWKDTQNQLQAEWLDISSKRAKLEASVQMRAAQIQTAQAASVRLHALVGSSRQRETDFNALAQQGFISSHALQDKSRDRLDIENELVRVRAEQATAVAAHKEAQKELTAYLAETHKTLAQRQAHSQQEMQRLTQEQVKTQQRLHLLHLKAPVSGIVQQLAVHTTGGVVTPAQPLMVIVPTGNDITAEVMVSNKDIGFVHVGQKVRIKFETFSFTRYGTVDGEMTWVSADALTRDPQNAASATNPSSNGQAPLAYFPAHVKLHSRSLKVEGKDLPITPGLNMTAEIKTGRRTVLDYLLSPIQKTLDESAGER